MTTFLMIAGGLVLLFAAGEVLVRGAVLLAARLGVTPLVIGVTVVGFGTSAPELATSLEAALSGSPGIALGNVVGSNLANVLLILGTAALISPIICDRRTAIRDGVLMVAAGALLAAMALGGTIGRPQGYVLVVSLLGYLGFVWMSERRKARDGQAELGEAPPPPPPGLLPKLREAAFLIGGLVGVIAGGRLLVIGAIDLAETMGVSDTLIGLTIVALGTSLPELAAAVAAAKRHEPEIAYGNVVGSNVFNLLGIVGVTAATTPLDVPPELLAFELPFVVVVMAAMAAFALTGGRISRVEGAILAACYFAYMTYLIV